ncbi:M20/M25/M40 family metallo-hydrolase [Phenylobacterium sp. VNQ135]|uniref:M20/M25/M40 family metallo-hydrolase n=1 Tax=Phenylobacterium sp. VNQ135 TaxID=3400922 RepID=UPI003BFC8708
MGRLVALVVALVVGVIAAWRAERPPEPLGVDAPASAFSATRAMVDVEAMARAPHPIGSPENRRVRDHLMRRMSDLGLSPQVQPGVGVQQRDDAIFGGPVENLVGILPGRDRSAPALALMAHYDSVPGSPGAADDAAGTAAALEIVRAIKARGVPARDVMVVITDGEEAGLLGADHFFARDPLAKRIGLVLNMETRGAGGRVQMFQTSSDNGELVGLLRRTAERPSSSSLTVFIYEQMPNDTDLSEALRAGVPGMNWAFIGRQFQYHSPNSTPANLEKGSLQDMGTQVQAVAMAAAFDPALPGKAPSLVYSQVFGDLVIAYPPWLGWLLLAAALALGALAFQRARKAERFSWLDVGRGAGALIFTGLSVAVVLMFAREATGAGFGFMQQRFLLAQVGRWEAAVALIGVGVLLLAAAELARGRRIVALVPLLAGVGCSAFGRLDLVALAVGVVAAIVGVLAYGKPVSRPAGWAGVLLAGLALAVAAQVLAPPAAHVLAWPLLAAALAAAATDFGVRRGYPSLALLALIATVVLAWLGNLAHGAFLSMDLMPLLALPAVLAALVLWPLAQPADGAPPGRGLGAALLVAGLAVTTWVRFADPYDARTAEAASVIYHVDNDARRGRLVSTTPDRVPWSEAAMAASGPVRPLRHWYWSAANRAGPAPFVTLPPPTVSLVSRPDGTVALRVAGPPGATLGLRVTPDANVALVSVDGAPLTGALKGGKPTTLRWAAPQMELVMRPTKSGAMQVGASAVLPTWPAGAKPLPPMPADVMAWGNSGTTLVTGSQRLVW